MNTTEQEIKQQAELYVQGKSLINPFEAYEGFIAGYNAALRKQSKTFLQESVRIKELEEIKVSQLADALQKEREKNFNAGPGNNNGNGNTNPGGNNGNAGPGNNNGNGNTNPGGNNGNAGPGNNNGNGNTNPGGNNGNGNGNGGK